MWAGDKIFLKALDERRAFFSLKLRYRGEELVEAHFGQKNSGLMLPVG